MNRVSVIVPIYNVGRYLTRCIDSILKQSHEDLEIVLVDDGSTDECVEMCDVYAARDSRIIVVHKPNGGLISARVAGLAAATASLAMFVDGDDWIEPDCISRCVEAWENNDVDLVCFGTLVCEADGVRQRSFGLRAGLYTRADIEKEVFPLLVEDEYGRHFDTSLWGKLYDSDRLRAAYVGVDDCITLGEDGVVTRPYVLACESMCVLDRCLYNYNRENQSSMTRSLKPISWDNARMIRKRFLDIFSPLGIDWVRQVNRNTAHNLLITTLSQFNGKDGYLRTSQSIRREMKKPEWRGALQDTGYKSTALKAMTFCMRHGFVLPIWLYSKTR